jgi:hypothetical protein
MENHNTEHEHEHHETAHHNKRKMNTLNKCINSCKRNPWIMITGILAVILVVVLFVGNPVTGKVISSEEAGQK